MDFTNEVLADMKQKKALYNGKFANWYYGMYKESGGLVKKFKSDGRTKLFPSGGVESYFNRGDRISSCCNLWLWDKYEKNKLLDLKRLNRCKNSRFCPNCKMLNVAKFIHEFKAKIPILEDYDLFLLTLTVPSENCDGVGLSDMITKIYGKFQKLVRKFSADLLTPTGKVSSQALQERFVTFAGGVRVLEVTYSRAAGFHPHLHCVVAIRKGSYNADFLRKIYKGKYSRKSKSFNYKSDIDKQIGKAWTMLWYGLNFRKWDSVAYDINDTYVKIDGVMTEYKNLEVDFTPMDDGGIFEVFKYTFKSSDVTSFNVFKVLVDGLAYKRIRQGFGILYDLKCDDDNDGEYQDLKLTVEEEPIEILTREFDELLTTFSDYRKVSRFNPEIKKDIMSNIAD